MTDNTRILRLLTSASSQAVVRQTGSGTVDVLIPLDEARSLPEPGRRTEAGF
jgi:hypothetical protein